MAKKQKCPECKEGAPEWMTTYGDMVTLLMCFFVLLFAFSTIDQQKFEAVKQSFQGSAGILSGGTTLEDFPLAFDGLPEETSSSNPEVIQQERMDQLKEALQEQINEFTSDSDLDFEIKVEITEEGFIIRLPDNVFFDPGQAVLKPESLDVLVFLGELLNSEAFAPYELRAEGHTDNVPSNTLLFPTNWELSSARASSVVRFFQDDLGMSTDRLAIAGYGEYRPISDNTTPEGRSKNRRVDIVIIMDKLPQQEETQQ